MGKLNMKNKLIQVIYLAKFAVKSRISRRDEGNLCCAVSKLPALVT